MVLYNWRSVTTFRLHLCRLDLTHCHRLNFALCVQHFTGHWIFQFNIWLFIDTRVPVSKGRKIAFSKARHGIDSKQIALLWILKSFQIPEIWCLQLALSMSVSFSSFEKKPTPRKRAIPLAGSVPSRISSTLGHFQADFRHTELNRRKSCFAKGVTQLCLFEYVYWGMWPKTTYFECHG